MLYSVLMSVYKNDNPNYFEKALLSMINQTLKPEQIVVVKDGIVTEEIQQILNKYDEQYPNLITQVQLEKNMGLGLALNEGIKFCRNELIARMDSDDISLPERCEKEIIEFQNDPELDIIGCQIIEFVGEPSNVVGNRKVPVENEEIYKFCKKRDPFNHPTVIYKKSIIESVGCYSDLRKNQDTDLWIKLLIAGAKCKNLNESLLYFRFEENTYKKRKNWLNTKLLIEIRWRAYKKGFLNFWDFLQVFVGQMAIFILPFQIQKLIYCKLHEQNKIRKGEGKNGNK